HPQPVSLAGLAAVALALLVLVAGSFRTLRAAHAGRARDLAHAVHAQLAHVRHAVRLTARQEPLRRLLACRPADPDRACRRMQALLDPTKHDFNKWFTWSGTDPLLNLFLMDEHGILLVDSLPDSRAAGRSFIDRDYARPLREPGRDGVYVSRPYLSQQD